jgi:hypothetical protein
MGKTVCLILLSVEVETPDETTAEDAVLVAAPELLPPRVSVGIFESECFRCLIFEVVGAIVVGVFNDRFFRVPVPLFFEGRESAVPALTQLGRWS